MTAMDAIPVLLIIWAAILACFLGLLAYKGQLTATRKTSSSSMKLSPTSNNFNLKLFAKSQRFSRLSACLA